MLATLRIQEAGAAASHILPIQEAYCHIQYKKCWTFERGREHTS
jgi:hypothetical protein